MSSPSAHRRHHSTEYSPHKIKNRIIAPPPPSSRRRPGSESDILEAPGGAPSLQHQDSIQLGYHQRHGIVHPRGAATTLAARHVKPVYIWTQGEVQRWLKRHSERAYEKYGEKIIEHEVTGRVLIALNDLKLMRMGVLEPDIREELITEILKLRLKNYMQCFKGLENCGMFEVL